MIRHQRGATVLTLSQDCTLGEWQGVPLIHLAARSGHFELFHYFLSLRPEAIHSLVSLVTFHWFTHGRGIHHLDCRIAKRYERPIENGTYLIMKPQKTCLIYACQQNNLEIVQRIVSLDRDQLNAEVGNPAVLVEFT